MIARLASSSRPEGPLPKARVPFAPAFEPRGFMLRTPRALRAPSPLAPLVPCDAPSGPEPDPPTDAPLPSRALPLSPPAGSIGFTRASLAVVVARPQPDAE